MQIVKAVEEHRALPPARRRRTQRVERPPGEQIAVELAGALELPAIGEVQPGQLAPVGRARLIRSRPRGQGAREARRTDERALQLADQLAGGDGEPGGLGGAGQPAQLCAAHCPLEQPLALALGQSLRPQADPARDLIGQAAERHHRAQQRPVGHELAGVMLGVGRCGHDEHGTPRRGRGVSAEHFAGLGRVGRAEHEGQGHPHMVARGPDGMDPRATATGPGTGASRRAPRHWVGHRGTSRAPRHRSGTAPPLRPSPPRAAPARPAPSGPADPPDPPSVSRSGRAAPGPADPPDPPDPVKTCVASPDFTRDACLPRTARSTCAASPERERGSSCPRLRAARCS